MSLATLVLAAALNPGGIIAWLVIGLLADKILFSPVERFLHRRWGTNS